MCGIFASADAVRFLNLLKANSMRGNHCTTITTFKRNESGGFTPREYFRTYFARHESVPTKFIVGADYIVGHIQAPTQGLGVNMGRSHPHVADDGSMLWHNGIIKPSFCNTIKEMLEISDTDWDTALLHKFLNSYVANYDQIDGAFACLRFKDNEFHMFRNSTSPLFYGFNGGSMPDISSVKSSMTRNTLVHNCVFKVDTTIESVLTFNNINTPYYIPEQK